MSLNILRLVRKIGFGVRAEIGFEKRDGDEIWGRLSGLILCLELMCLVPCLIQMLFLLLFDEMTTHENRLEG